MTGDDTVAQPTSIEIAQTASMRRITQIAQERLGIPEAHLDPYGR